MSKRNLSEQERNVLAKGLNFAITPTLIPYLEIIKSIESTLELLTPDLSEEYRWKIRGALEREINITPNITKQELEAIKCLEEDSTIKIMRADKGNKTVVMDSMDYNKKIESMLKTTDYKQLKNDLTKAVEKLIKSTLKITTWKYRKKRCDKFPPTIASLHTSMDCPKYTKKMHH